MKPQKAKHLHLEMEKVKPNIGGDYAVFEKHDGWYGYLDFIGCGIHSNATREIPSLVELSNMVRSRGLQCRGRLIFEIMIKGLEVDSFPTLNGILNRKYEQAEEVYLRVHDYLPNFRCDVPFSKRYSLAQEIVASLDMPEVVMSPVLEVSDKPEQWQALAENQWNMGREGVILKRMSAFYSPTKRNSDLMKIKEELTLDLVVVGTFEGEGKYKGTLGGLLVKDKYHIVHRVSGMTDAERNEWYKDPSKIIGKIVEIKAMKRLKDGSLREPRFKAVRWNKIDTDD